MDMTHPDIRRAELYGGGYEPGEREVTSPMEWSVEVEATATICVTARTAAEAMSLASDKMRRVLEDADIDYHTLSPGECCGRETE